MHTNMYRPYIYLIKTILAYLGGPLLICKFGAIQTNSAFHKAVHVRECWAALQACLTHAAMSCCAPSKLVIEPFQLYVP